MMPSSMDAISIHEIREGLGFARHQVTAVECALPIPDKPGPIQAIVCTCVYSCSHGARDVTTFRLQPRRVKALRSLEVFDKPKKQYRCEDTEFEVMGLLCQDFVRLENDQHRIPTSASRPTNYALPRDACLDLSTLSCSPGVDARIKARTRTATWRSEHRKTGDTVMVHERVSEINSSFFVRSLSRRVWKRVDGSAAAFVGNHLGSGA